MSRLDDIRAAARALFAARGFDGTLMRAIAVAAGADGALAAYHCGGEGLDGAVERRVRRTVR